MKFANPKTQSREWQYLGAEGVLGLCEFNNVIVFSPDSNWSLDSHRLSVVDNICIPELVNLISFYLLSYRFPQFSKSWHIGPRILAMFDTNPFLLLPNFSYENKYESSSITFYIGVNTASNFSGKVVTFMATWNLYVTGNCGVWELRWTRVCWLCGYVIYAT